MHILGWKRYNTSTGITIKPCIYRTITIMHRGALQFDSDARAGQFFKGGSFSKSCFKEDLETVMLLALIQDPPYNLCITPNSIIYPTISSLTIHGTINLKPHCI